MELKVNKEIVTVKETVFDGMQEQSIELDYILPDYYPEIFKLIKCQVCPKILSYSVNDDKVVYELAVQIRIMYCSEESTTLQCITQKLNYSKSIDLGKTYDSVTVCLSPKTDYVNCRVVNQRRLDIRGAVTIKAKVFAEQKREVISDAFGLNAQIKKQAVPCASNKLSAIKQFIIDEDIELNMSNPPVLGIVRADAVINPLDKKIIANKLVSKGDVILNVLYSCEKDDKGSLEAMQFNLPYSQIVDMDGINETFDCIINAEVADCDVTSVANNDGDSKMLHCEIVINLTCSALKSSVTEIATDAFSTTYQSDFTTSPVRIEQFPAIVEASHQTKSTVEYKDGEIDCVYDIWASVSNVNSSINPDDKKFSVSGMIHYCVMIRNENCLPVLLEKDDTFEFSSIFNGITSSTVIEPKISVMACSYNLSSANTISVKADLKICANLYSSSEIDVITDLNIDENSKKQQDGDYAIKLYYGVENEDIWDIAKKYNSSVDAIINENDLTGDKLDKSGMIIIPIFG